jgi:hypothetical protein
MDSDRDHATWGNCCVQNMARVHQMRLGEMAEFHCIGCSAGYWLNMPLEGFECCWSPAQVQLAASAESVY